jgi:ankyrin repeat protein
MREHQKGKAGNLAHTSNADAEKYISGSISSTPATRSTAPAGFGELEYALCSKDHEKARRLITCGYDPRTISPSNSYPMAIAACCESIEAVAMLTSYCADFEPPAPYLHAPLIFSLNCSNNKAALFLIEHGADVEQSYVKEEKPLLKASQADNLEVAIAILDAGADRYAQDSNGMSCLRYFASSGRKNDLLALAPYYTLSDLFNSLRLSTNAFSTIRNLSLFFSTAAQIIRSEWTNQRKQRKISKSVLAAEFRKINDKYNLALALKQVRSIANITHDLRTKKIRLVPLLQSLYIGYDQRIKSCQDNAREKKNYSVISALIVESYGHPTYRDSSEGSNILHIAIELDIAILAEKLLKDQRFSVLVNSSNSLLNRPLHIATQLKLQWAIDLLLSVGADVNPCNREGLTPLHIAIIDQNLPAVKSLINHRANVYLTPRNNRGVEASIKSVLASNPSINEFVQRSMGQANSASIFSKNNPFAPLVRSRKR